MLAGEGSRTAAADDRGFFGAAKRLASSHVIASRSARLGGQRHGRAWTMKCNFDPRALLHPSMPVVQVQSQSAMPRVLSVTTYARLSTSLADPLLTSRLASPVPARVPTPPLPCLGNHARGTARPLLAPSTFSFLLGQGRRSVFPHPPSACLTSRCSSRLSLGGHGCPNERGRREESRQ